MIKRLIFLLISFTIVFVLSPTKVFAQTILFADDFNDGNANDWVVIGNFGWVVQDGMYGIHLEPGVSNTIPSNEIWGEDWNNIIYEVDLLGTSGTDKNIIFHFKDISNYYEIHHTGEFIYLEKYVPTPTSIQLAPRIHYPLINGRTYRFKIEIDGDHIKVHEGTNSLFDVVDATGPKIVGGKIGLRAGTGGVSPTEVWFDNVVVTTLPPQSLMVPDIKQYSPPWNNDIYNHATSWSSNPYIERWGCALTSASMVLKYFNHDADPDYLNNWLTSQPDGYLRNGLLNWLAISRFSKSKSDSDSPILKYLRSNSNPSILNSDLLHNRPDILQLPGHFVVARGILGTDFLINDPASTNTLLSQNGGSFLALNRYIPTNTDLSYIMLAANPTINIKLFGSDNNPAGGQFFVDQPLIDDIDHSSTSGNPLAIYILPTPNYDEYLVKLDGNPGIFWLDAYLYDKNGDPLLTSFEGLANLGKYDLFKITVGENLKIMPIVTFDSILEDLEIAREQNFIYKVGVYKSLRIQILTAKRFQLFEKNTLSRKILMTIKEVIHIIDPWLINPQVSKILQSNLQILINSI